MGSALSADVRRALEAAGATGGQVAAGVELTAATYETWGPVPAGSAVEAGSVTKGVTGLLLSLAHAAGEVSPEDALGRFLGVGGASGVTLAELATHTSGLPRLPRHFTLHVLTHLRDPYRDVDLERLLRATRRTPVGPAGTFAYSNLGVALLGQALARAAGTDYWTLATDRVLQPLGMLRSGALPDDQTWSSGHLWDLRAFAPAGGLRAPLVDLFALAWLVARPEESPLAAAATDALAPRRKTPHGHIGWCWMTSPSPSGDVHWHNGGTGASWTMIAGSARAAVAANVPGRVSPAYDRAVLQTLGDPEGRADRGGQA